MSAEATFPLMGPHPFVHPRVQPRQKIAAEPAPLTTIRPAIPKRPTFTPKATAGVGQRLPGRNDNNYHLDHPWAHGHFGRNRTQPHLPHGRSSRHSDRFWFGGFFMLRALRLRLHQRLAVERHRDDIVIYDDPDHPGWYFAYNTHLGTYAHIVVPGQPDAQFFLKLPKPGWPTLAVSARVGCPGVLFNHRI